VGPHGRTLADCAVTLGVIQSRTFDGHDPATGSVPLGWQGTGQTRPTNIPTDYTQFLNPHGLQGARIGLTRAGLNGFDPNVPTPACPTMTLAKVFTAPDKTLLIEPPLKTNVPVPF
jgi:amidase